MLILILFIGFFIFSPSIFSREIKKINQVKTVGLSDNNLGKTELLKDELGEFPKKTNNLTKPEELIEFSFNEKPLTEIIDLLGTKKDANIIMPQSPVDMKFLKEQTVTYNPIEAQTVTLNQAWRLLQTFLELSGFSLTKREDDLYVIARVSKRDEAGIIQEPLPLYVDVPPIKLPKSEQYIRYIYYLRNLKIPDTPNEQKNSPINQIITQMQTSGSPEPIYLPKSNGVILVDKADIIASIMYIISELDSTGFKETIEVIPIHYIPSSEIAAIFKLMKSAAGKEKASPFIKAQNKPENITYFAADTTVIADDRNNTLIMMGREAAIKRISDFVRNYLDLPPESGESILHTYDLQYLNAEQFAPVINKIIEPIATTPQAVQSGLIGTERFFQGAYVTYERTQAVPQVAPTTEGGALAQTAVAGFDEGPLQVGIQGQLYTGGNRLLIAALPQDWQKIRALIQSLDHPQPQVIIEVLIVDFTRSERKIVAGTVRTPTDPVNINQAVQLLASHITPPVNVLGAIPSRTPNAIAVDLLGVAGILDDSNILPLTALIAPGSTLFSFNDPTTPGIMGVLQILSSLTNAKVVSHPYLITSNNQKATITSQIVKRAQGPAIPGEAGVTKIEIINLPATIQVQVIPKLSSLERMSLQIAVDVNEFTGAGIENLTRITRRAETNANIGTGEILVIGGLTTVNENDSITETPFLSKIPIIGNFFKGVNRLISRTNLAIFISPTIVEPRLRSGVNTYTADKIRKSRRDISEAILFDSYDPVTQLFFRAGEQNDDILQEFIADSTNAPTMEQIKTSKERKLEKSRPKPIISTASAKDEKIVKPLPA